MTKDTDARRADGGAARRLWSCPRCGHKFVTPNIWHSCAVHTLDEHFAGRPPELRRVFERYVGLAESCGPVTVYAQKSRIVIQDRVRFASVVVRRRWLDAALWLKRRAEHHRLIRVEDLGRSNFIHHFRLEHVEEVDPALGALMREAYASGQ
jgi:hypothetical protein